MGQRCGLQVGWYQAYIFLNGCLPKISSFFVQILSKEGILGFLANLRLSLVTDVPMHCLPAGSACSSKLKFRPVAIFRPF